MSLDDSLIRLAVTGDREARRLVYETLEDSIVRLVSRVIENYEVLLSSIVRIPQGNPSTNGRSKSLCDIDHKHLATMPADYSRVVKILDAILRESLQGVAK